MQTNLYVKQARTWLRPATFLLAACFSTTVAAQEAPSKPANLSASADYSKVVLTWDRGVKADTVLKEGFENDAFPPAGGWDVDTANDYDQYFTWFHFPTDEVKENIENWESYVHSGGNSAAVFFDDACPHEDGTPGYQDEWLIMPATKGAQYLTFYTMIDPMVLEWGTSADFKDHYYVKVSHDGGKTWTVVYDARYDSNGSSAWQPVTLYLGDQSLGDAIVAFQAVSDPDDMDNGLYFTWFVDDVRLLTDQPSASAPSPAPTVNPLAGRKAYRVFKPSGLKAQRPEYGFKAPAAPESYDIFLDDEYVLAENVKANTYTDVSEKEPGEHTYAVRAVSNSTGLVSETAEVKVNIERAPVNAPKDVKVTYTYNEDKGNYDVSMTWSEPDGPRKPVYYNTYCNNALFGGYLEDLEVGQTGVSRGVYNYTVVAVYESPDGESEAVGDVVALGTRNTPYALSAVSDELAGTLALSWKAPKESEYEVKDYLVYRGNTKIGETTATSFCDEDFPAGVYDYNVKAVYADGFVSLPATVSVTNGKVRAYELPFEEDFTGGMKPENWTVEKVDGKMKDNYLWRFDNWYELPVTGGGFSGEFASVNSSSTGLTNVYTTLDTPPLLRNAADGERTMIEFDMDYESGGQKSEAGLFYSYDGESWGAIEGAFEGYMPSDLADGETCKPVHKSYDITPCFPNNDTPVMFAWMYNGKRGNHLAIDNVRIYNTSGTGIGSVKAGVPVDYTVEGNVLSLSGKALDKVQVFAADGSCVSNVEAGGADNCRIQLPSNGVYVVKVASSEGTSVLKLGK